MDSWYVVCVCFVCVINCRLTVEHSSYLEVWSESWQTVNTRKLQQVLAVVTSAKWKVALCDLGQRYPVEISAPHVERTLHWCVFAEVFDLVTSKSWSVRILSSNFFMIKRKEKQLTFKLTRWDYKLHVCCGAGAAHIAIPSILQYCKCRDNTADDSPSLIFR